MSLFARKKKEVQDAEYTDTRQTELVTDAVPEEIKTEEAVTAEAEQATENTYAAEAEQAIENTYDAEEKVDNMNVTEASDGFSSVSEDSDAQPLYTGYDLTVSSEEAEAAAAEEDAAADGPYIPEGDIDFDKYKMDQVYREIGEEYCNLHANDPEIGLKDKVGIINAMKRKSAELKDALNALGRSPWFLLLILLMTGLIALRVLAKPDISTYISLIPAVLVDLACLILFIQALARKMTGIGFTILNGVMTFYMIVLYIPIVAMLMLGVIMRFDNSAESKTASYVMIIIAIICAVINWIYWNGIKSTTKAARTIASGGIAQMKSSIFVSFILVISLLADLFVLISTLIFNKSLESVLQAISTEINNTLHEEVITSSMLATITSTGSVKMYYMVAASVVQILIFVVVILILSRIRNMNKPELEEIEAEQ